MTSLDLGSVEIRGGPLVLVAPSDVESLEGELGTILPEGYRDYVTRLGSGTLNNFVRVLVPTEIRGQLEEHRGLMAGYWFWDEAPDGIDQEWALDSVPIADTLDGDALAFHPANPGQIVILPRNLPRAYARDDGFLETIGWVCSGRVLRSFGPKRYFEPFNADDRRSVHGDAASLMPTVQAPPERTSVPPYGGAASPREHLLAYFAALRDAEEHEVQRSGGPQAFTGSNPPDSDMFDETAFEVSVRRFNAAHERYCTPRLAAALGGSTTASWPLPHDPSMFEVRQESMTKSGTAVIRVAESMAPGLFQIVEYRLNPDGDGWQVASKRDLDVEESPRQSRLSRLLRRSK